MEQSAQERQLDLLMLTADDVAPRLFDLTTRAQIITLLKVPERSPRPRQYAGGDGR